MTSDEDVMDDTPDDKPTAQWRPVVDDGADAPTQVVRFPSPRPRPMPDQQAPGTQNAPQQPQAEQSSGTEQPTVAQPQVTEPTGPEPADPEATGTFAAASTQVFPAAGTDPTPATPTPATPGEPPAGATRPVTPPPADPEADDPEALHPAMATVRPTEDYGDLPAAEVKAGDVFAERYRLEQPLAARGGALTWRAFDQKLSRSVLVHVLRHDDPRTPEVLEAARKAAFATDSRFLRVLDAVAGEGAEDPSLVVCEFAPGESLERLLRQGPLSALEAAWVARELADALSAMHAEGLFHQRLNPDTVVITTTGNVKIVGFLIESAMYPDGDEQDLAWSERENADVLALGKVLYSSLVTRWPTPREQMLDDDGQPRVTWGMPAAPMDGRGWLTPRQIRSGVSPALDVICDQILSPTPRHNEMPLRTAGQVMLALNKVLGTADAAADLERRMRYPVVPVGQQGRGEADRDPNQLDTTARLRAVGRDDDRGAPGAAAAGPAGAAAASAAAVGGLAAARGDASPAQGASRPSGRSGSSNTSNTPSQRATAQAARRAPASRPRPRRWLAILLALVALMVIIGLVRHFTAGKGSSQTTQTGSSAISIAAIDDFDPTADGGNGEENPTEAKLADDGNPATAWQTVTYLNDPALGKLKPGVGLVVDLGHSQKVGQVKLTLQGQPTAVQLRIPATTANDKPPMTSSKQWSVVASNASAGTSVTLTPSSAVETRYLLVYLTKLPKVATNKYRGGIAQIEVGS